MGQLGHPFILTAKESAEFPPNDSIVARPFTAKAVFSRFGSLLPVTGESTGLWLIVWEA